MKKSISIEGDTLSALRSLIVGHRIDKKAPVPRAGRVILRARPVLAIRNGVLHDMEKKQPIADAAQELLPTFRARLGPAVAKIAQIVAEHASGVGRIEVVAQSGQWIPVGTGFLAHVKQGEAPRILTAGHVASFLLSPAWPGALTRALYPKPFLTFPEHLTEARICFEDDPNAQPIGTRINRIVWPHSMWDMAICELEQDPGRRALPLETDVGWAQTNDEPMAVLGYPLDASTAPDAQQHEALAGLFTDRIGTKCLTPGLMTNALEPTGAIPNPPSSKIADMRHDATTLGGNSGSPVFSMRTGKVVGLHYAGGAYVVQGDAAEGGALPRSQIDSSANRSVHLPFVLAEPRLLQEVFSQGDPAERSPVSFDIGNSPWVPQRVDENAELEGKTQISAAIKLSDGIKASISPAILASTLQDRPDDRDVPYVPPLIAVPPTRLLPNDPTRVILNQGNEAACTAFALAAVINQQSRAICPEAPLVSTRMLFEMAQAHDEWIEDSPEGSSLRGALKGFDHGGVCRQKLAPFFPTGQRWTLSRALARDAANVTMGTYLRLSPRLNDFQVAINTVGSILVSAKIHKGWIRPAKQKIRKIRFQHGHIGCHAFVILGYDQTGFIIQNSWGGDWSNWQDQPGLAHWSYDDWAENLLDAWVIRLSANTPKGFDLRPKVGIPARDKNNLPAACLPRPKRYALVGHIVHVEPNGLVEQGRFGLGIAPLIESASELQNNNKIKHVALLFHDPFMPLDTINRIAGHLTPTFLRNGIFPLHIVYGNDAFETIRIRIKHEAEEISKRFVSDHAGAARYLSRRAGQLLPKFLRGFSHDAATATQPGEPLWRATAALTLDAVRGRKMHMVVIGNGSIGADAQISRILSNQTPPINQVLRLGCATPAPIANWGNAPPLIREIPLDPAKPSADDGIFVGDWVDIVAGALGYEKAPRKFHRSADMGLLSKASTIESALIDPKTLNWIVTAIKGRKPSKTLRFDNIGSAQ